MPPSETFQLTPHEIANLFAGVDPVEQSSPILKLDQAAQLLRCSVHTLRDWRLQGRLNSSTRKLGKHLRILRHRFLEDGFNHDFPVAEFHNLTDSEIERIFCEPQEAQRFPPVLKIPEAADLLQIPVGTLRDWRSRGLLKPCCRKVRGEVKLIRQRLIKHLFNDGLRAKH